MQRLGTDIRFREIFLDGWRPCAWIVAIGLILYLKTCSFGFCYFDDQDLIVQNKFFLSDANNIFRAFALQVYPKSIATPYYRPLLIVSFILNAQIGGIGPFVYHLTNIAIHLIASSLVFVLFLKLGYRRGLSFFFALVFTVHPVLAQAVAWVPGRNDSMLAAFAIASVAFFLDYLASHRTRDYLAHLLFLVLALFTKESGFIVIAVCGLYLVIVKGREAIRSRWKELLAGWSIVCLAWFIPRYVVTKGSDPTTLYDLWHLVVPQIPAVAQLIGKALFPVNQSVFPTMRQSTGFYGLIAIALVGLLALFSKNGSRRMMLFGASWLALFLLPPLMRSHAPVIDDVLEHRLYMPIIGLMIVLMETDIVKASTEARRRLLAASGAGIILVFFCKSFLYIERFRDPAVFWEDAVRASPRSAFARVKLGEVYYRADRLDDALRQLQEGMRLDFATTFTGHYYLGHIHMKKGDMASAEKEFRKTIALMPDNDWAYMSLGVICYRTGRAAEAESLWKKSLRARAENFEAAKNLALYYAEKGDFASARYYAEWLRRLGIEPPAEFFGRIGGQ